jgi:hypothetical protein
MLKSRGMGAVNPSKMPRAQKAKRRDKATFVQVGAKNRIRPRKDGSNFTTFNKS